ncbi:Putative DNA damage-responsive repressor GIS1/RPH1, jumonji superfamily [Aspergillus calidoustus]|uniref:[histone H3]-trimethyl-L-lysine(9) demethylase n=1 Tax=Aspergillus calidoustus TaxID=454130 RepID=A0A0U5GYN4_ASPCI|nr:Putative DNA damage-responsive repressor GIS1/RPH1, jumonji superfamily [Aspergillus calidoustus]
MAATIDRPFHESIAGGPATDAASITPPHSVNGRKDAPDGVPSELSDLELDSKAVGAQEAPSIEDAEELEEIEPDHYYGGGKIPVFKPTMDQFRDFQTFINRIDKYGMRSGIVKVIPPKEWRDALPPLDEAVKKIRVKNPIMQEFHGSHGTYTQANIERQRSYNLPQWKGLCEDGSHQPPARRGERRRNQERVTKAPAAPKPPTTRSDTPKRGPGRPPKRSNQAKAKEEPKIKEEPVEDSIDKTKPEGPPTPVSPESNPVETKSEDLSDGESLSASKSRGRQPRSVTARRKQNKGDAVDHVDEEAFKDFNYRITDNAEYTYERCEELETAYWKSLMFNNPMYGADMPGSLFDDNTTCWNVAKLPNLLDVIGQKVPGVNTAYLYLGMWKATFAWHLEDVDLYSINYIHFGAPKQWYSISQEDAPRFEQVMKSIWPSDAKTCDQFLRHKTYLVSPSLLKSQYGITVNKLVHYEGEFVITYPYGYHSGYNLGYNCAESVNFATEKWMDYGRVAKKCNCEADSVWIDIEDIERKLRGEATPEYYGEFDSDLDGVEGASDLLTPPRSVPEKTSTRGRKRKLDGDTTKAKRMRMSMDIPRKIPCLLCPNDLDYEDLLPTEDGKSHAHRRCALYTEETSILRDETGKEVVCDIDKIPKARMGLKCLFCREVRGACFQCNFGKCTRSYHATCALLAGVQAEEGQVAVVADDGNQYSVPSVDLKCKYHRQKRPTWMTSSESPENDRKLIETAKRLVIGDLVQFQVDKEINGAVILENRPTERTLLAKMLPRGDVIELPYRWMLVVRRSNFAPLAAGIKPLPVHLARKPESRSHLESALPVAGNPFGDGRSPYQWAEFETVDSTNHPAAPPNVQVNLDKGEQIWYYMGQSSTECRAQYTHNPSVPVHNPRSNFLDSVKSLGAVMARLPYPHHRLPPYVLTAPPPHLLSSAAATTTASALAVPAAAAAAFRPSLPQRPPFAPPPRSSPAVPPRSAAAVAASAMPSAYRSLPNQSARHAPYPQLTKSHLQSQQQHSHQQQQQNTNGSANNTSHLPANNFANVRELIARRRLLQITDHANVFAGYTIVGPELVVETLLGPMGSVPPSNGLEKLELAMAQQRVQPRAPDGTVLPMQPLNMRSEEVTRLLQMLRFSLISHRDRLDVLQKKESETVKQETANKTNGVTPKVPKTYAYLELQREQAPAVYRSPYDMPSGFTEYARTTYGLTRHEPELPKPSLANDYFASLSPENQEKILKTCGSFVQRAMERSAPHSRQSSSSNLRLSSALAQQTENPTIDITTVEDMPLSGIDFHLRPESPCSSFSRSHLRFHSPNDFTSHGAEAHHDHHDLFGDQQANTRFWQHGPWAAGDGNTPNEESRPFFGPHERLKHDYASSDISLGRGGPGSLHSVDMAGFGLDNPDDLCAGLSP